MSGLLPVGPTTASTNTIPAYAQEQPLLTFPPFPAPPEGVSIMPFKDFKPRGIQLFSASMKVDGAADEDNDAELDALGIPTVELRVKHSTDVCKSSARKKRKKKKAAAAANSAPVKRPPWYEEWEEGENLRVTKGNYDLSIPSVDRFFQSASDFRSGRPWPPVSSGLNNLWDQFRLFVGLLVNPSSFRKVGAKKYAPDPCPDYESDDEDEEPMINMIGGSNAGEDGDARPKKRHRADDPDSTAAEDDIYEDDADPQDPYKLDEDARDERISKFLRDPEKAVRIFLSSHMRERGLIWSERNLIFTPRLVSFFLAFVLRNRVLPEPTYQRGLKRALETVEHAKKELPLIYKVARILPDAFSDGCKECFGRKGGYNWTFATANEVEEKKTATTAAQAGLKETVDDSMQVDITVPPPPPATNVTMDNPAAETNGWGGGWDGMNGWGKDAGDSGGWGEGAWNLPADGNEAKDSQAGDGDDGTNNENDPTSSWAAYSSTWTRPTPSLTTYLGPSVLPLTHTTGVVESSTRRVCEIHPPAVTPSVGQQQKRKGAKGSKAKEWAPSASGAESKLDAHFAKVVLAPWGREEGDISRPEIWETSRGPVIHPNPQAATVSKGSTATSGSNEVGTARKPHDPLIDTITLLVDPEVAEALKLVPGIGVTATWVEIVRLEEVEGETGGSKRAVDGSAQGAGYPKRFWYHEDVTSTFPSFYTAKDWE
ncbi:hypothetical protein F5I97DRAFT_816422 [Phlebopus sp. FC_14]|nr:hypothetical protein F5I97DRAFT_816422 [Phlebopus sp. FC_14]